MNNYLTNDGKSIVSVTKTNGEKIFFTGDGGKYDAASDMVIGPTANDGEVSIPSPEIRLVNTERPNPMMPVFEGLVVAAGVIVGVVLLYFAIFPPQRKDY
jgi:hypothetical protein